MLVSVPASVATVVGVLGTETGIGAALASGALVVDTIEDAANVGAITAKFLRFTPEKARVVGAFVGQRLGDRIPLAARQALEKIGRTRVAARFVEGLTAQRLANTRLLLDADDVTTIAKAVTDVDSGAGGLVARSTRVVEIAKRVDGLAREPAQVQRRIVRALLRRSDGLRLADELDATTLRVALDAGRLDEAADIVKHAERDGELLSKLDSTATRRFLTYTVRKADDVPADLEQGVRRRLAVAFSNGQLSATSLSQVVTSIVEVEATPQVRGLARVLAADVYRTEDWFNVRGALYEILETARVVVPNLRRGDEVIMGLKPSREADVVSPLFRIRNFDFDLLENIDQVAKRIAVRVTPKADSYDEIANPRASGLAEEIEDAYGLEAKNVDPSDLIVTQEEVKNTLRYGLSRDPDPEFDGMIARQGDTLRYDEMKSGQVNRRDIQRKLIFIHGYMELLVQNGNLGATTARSIDVRLIHRLPRSNSRVTGYVVDVLDDVDYTSTRLDRWDPPS